MARRPKLVLRKAERGIDLPATKRADTSQLYHLSEFLAWGTITIGHIDRAGQVAIAAEGKQRRPENHAYEEPKIGACRMQWS